MEANPEDLRLPLSEADWAKLAEMLRDDSWPETTLDLEGLDGVIAAGVCGPRGATPLRVLPLVFGLPDFPEFSSPDKFRRFLELTGRRWNEYAGSLVLTYEEMSKETFTEPFFYEIGSEVLDVAMKWVPPRNAGIDHQRPGDWRGRAWAEGFLRVVSEDEAWTDLFALGPEYAGLLAPFVLLELGFNPDNPRMRFEPQRWLGDATSNLYRFAAVFRQLDETGGASIPVTRAARKVGRNDPCPCGSGLKFKKCCGGNQPMH